MVNIYTSLLVWTISPQISKELLRVALGDIAHRFVGGNTLSCSLFDTVSHSTSWYYYREPGADKSTVS
jgi:hypothetical protein